MTSLALPSITTEICWTADATDVEASDTFNRADNAYSLGTADTGQAWLGSIQQSIVSNQAVLNGTGVAYLECLSGGTVSTTLGPMTLASGETAGLSFRVKDPQNYWRFTHFLPPVGSPYVSLDKVVAGAVTNVGTHSLAFGLSAGDIISVTLAGTSITTKVNGATAVTTTDSTFQHEARAGLYADVPTSRNNAKFDSFSALFDWTDVSTYVQTAGDNGAGPMVIQRGKQFELNRTEAGECRLSLSNVDRRFEPEYSGSPYYPFVLPMRRLRVTATDTVPTTYTRFYGYIEDFPFVYNHQGTDGIVQVTATDALAAYAYARFDAYPELVASLSPLLYVRNSTGTDSSTHAYTVTTVGAPGTVSPGLLPALAGDDGGFSFAGAGATDGFQAPTATRIPSATNCSFAGLVKNTANILLFNAYTATDALYLGVASGVLFVTGTLTGVTATLTGTVNVNDGNVHAVAIVHRGNVWELWVDGVLDTSGTGPSTWGATHDPAIGYYGAGSVNGGVGSLDEVGWWDRCLSPTEITALTVTARTGTMTAGQTTGQVVAAIADALHQPPTARDIDPGLSTVTDVTFTDPRATLDLLEATEEGFLFVDGSGNLCFHDRAHPHVSADTWGDDTSEINYLDVGFEPMTIHLTNQITVTGPAGTPSLAVDTDSRSQYFPKSLTRTVATDTTTDNQDHADYLLVQYKDPHVRINPLTVDGATATWAKVLGRELGDCLTVTRRINGVARTQTVIIEHLQHQVSNTQIVTTWELSPVPAFTRWDTAVWDTGEWVW